MKAGRAIIASAVLLAALPVAAGAASGEASTPSSRRMNNQERYQILRGLNAEYIFIRTPFPRGSHGLTLEDGKVTPTGDALRMALAQQGAAAKPGDRAQITRISFQDDAITFEINGGPRKKKKWYQHLQVGAGGRMTPVGQEDNQNPNGSWVKLKFAGFVPGLSCEQLKQMLAPVFDFSSLSAAQAYIDTMPPKIKQAMKNHEVLVGMNRDMVNYSMGRPGQKIRDRDERGDYEEWIYGGPPQDIEFIRFYGDIVGRVEIMKVDGEKIVRTEPEVTIAEAGEAHTTGAQPAASAAPPDTDAPSLRRPGEAAPAAGPYTGATPRVPIDTSPPPQTPHLTGRQ